VILDIRSTGATRPDPGPLPHRRPGSSPRLAAHL